MNLPDIPEYVAGYFNFIVDFAINPTNACAPYKASNKINKDLLTFAAIGATLTWLTIILIKKMGDYYHDKSHIFDFTDKLEVDIIPFVALPFIILLSLFVHLLVRLIFRFNKEDKGISPTQIDCKNTINGALAYFAFAPFLIMLSFFITMAIIFNIPKGLSGWQILLLVLPNSIFTLWVVLWCFPLSITAMQPDELRKSYKNAILTCFGLFFVIIVVLEWLKDLFH
jgi:hypothetical protein